MKLAALFSDGMVLQQGQTVKVWGWDTPGNNVTVALNGSAADAVAVLSELFDDAEGTAGDGLRLDWDDRWIQVRGSNTEAIVRVIAEAPEEVVARGLCETAMNRIRTIL